MTKKTGVDLPAFAKLDDEHCARVRDCLKKAGRPLPHDRFARFIGDIEASIAQFLATPPEGTFRGAHNALRQLWKLSHDVDPPVGEIRSRIQNLPEQAIAYIDRRVPNVIPRLFPGTPPVARFRDWAAIADAVKLIRATKVLSAEGARVVEGRSRGGGKRSGLQKEPSIMGEVRGSGPVRHQGGRPRNANYQHLVMHLALDWAEATGEAPKPGRSDNTGFGDLVHSLFQWLNLADGSATNTLRQYWANVKKS